MTDELEKLQRKGTKPTPDRYIVDDPWHRPATPAVGGKPVAWRYQRKKDWDDIWRCTTIEPDFETPYDWIVQALYAAPPASPLRGREALLLAREYISQDHGGFKEGDGYFEQTGEILQKIDVALASASPPEQPAAEDKNR